MMLIRLPGEPTNPAFAQSLVMPATVDSGTGSASNIGERFELAYWGDAVGRNSGV